MKKYITMAVLTVIAMVALVMLVGEMPDASLVHFTAVKIASLALLWLVAKIWEHTMPEEEV